MLGLGAELWRALQARAGVEKGIATMEKTQLLSRLRRIEGQTQGVQRMLDEDRACEDVLAQLLAIRSAVAQVCVGMMEQHVRDCVLGGEFAEDDPRMRELSESMKLLMRSG